MTKTFTSYPSIEQFRSVVKKVRDHASFHMTELPTLTFHGTVKLHGTNAAIAFTSNKPNEFWCQSRNNIITRESDNAGFANYMHDNHEIVVRFISLFDITQDSNSVITIYGEWCGGNIEKGIALSKLSKMFVVFGARVTSGETEGWWDNDAMERMFREYKEILNKHNVYSITQFPTFEIDIDFNRPELAQNILVEYTNEVERQCPVGTFFAVEGIGEGIVYTCEDMYTNSRLMFKVKGEKHSESKVKSLAEVDVEKIENIYLLVETIVTEHRLEKKIDDMKEQNIEIIIENTGQFLKIVNTDIMKEELDRIIASGFTTKEVMYVVSKVSRKWFLNLINNMVMQ